MNINNITFEEAVRLCKEKRISFFALNDEKDEVFSIEMILDENNDDDDYLSIDYAGEYEDEDNDNDDDVGVIENYEEDEIDKLLINHPDIKGLKFIPYFQFVDDWKEEWIYQSAKESLLRNRWIDINERPPDNDFVFVLLDNGVVIFPYANYKNGVFTDVDMKIVSPTHWMDVPEGVSKSDLRNDVPPWFKNN